MKSSKERPIAIPERHAVSGDGQRRGGVAGVDVEHVAVETEIEENVCHSEGNAGHYRCPI